MSNLWRIIRCYSHPLSNGNATINVVDNGIIENYMRLREWLTLLKKVDMKILCLKKCMSNQKTVRDILVGKIALEEKEF